MKWEWQVEGQVVSVDLCLLTGRERIYLDDTVLFDKISMKLRHEVPVPLASGRSGRVIVALGAFLMPVCSLIVDGQEVTPTRGRSGGLGDARALTWWQWGFVAACVVIPIMTMGGAVPAMIGLVAASSNWRIGTSARSNVSKLVLMAAVTAVAWGLVMALVLATSAARGSVSSWLRFPPEHARPASE